MNKLIENQTPVVSISDSRGMFVCRSGFYNTDNQQSSSLPPLFSAVYSFWCFADRHKRWAVCCVCVVIGQKTGAYKKKLLQGVVVFLTGQLLQVNYSIHKICIFKNAVQWKSLISVYAFNWLCIQAGTLHTRTHVRAHGIEINDCRVMFVDIKCRNSSTSSLRHFPVNKRFHLSASTDPKTLRLISSCLHWGRLQFLCRSCCFFCVINVIDCWHWPPQHFATNTHVQVETQFQTHTSTHTIVCCRAHPSARTQLQLL